MMSDSNTIQTTNIFSSSTLAGVGNYYISTTFPSSVTSYKPSITGGEINTVHETLSGLSTVSQYFNNVSAASSYSKQNDNSTVPPLEYSSTPPVNILTSMSMTSSLNATSDQDITDNELFSTLSILALSQIIVVSQTTVKHYFLSSLDMNSVQNGLLTSEKSSLQVDTMETHMNEPLLSSSSFLKPVVSSTSEANFSQLLHQQALTHLGPHRQECLMSWQRVTY